MAPSGKRKRQDLDGAKLAALAEDLQASPRQNANNLPLLISHLTSPTVQVAPIVQGLKLYFIGCFEREELNAQPPSTSSAAAAATAATANDGSPEAMYRPWLRRQFAACIDALLQLLCTSRDPRTQVSVFATLMEFTRGRPVGTFDNELFSRVVSMTLTHAGVPSEVLGALVDKYAEEYADIRYHLLRTVTKICTKRALLPPIAPLKITRGGVHPLKATRDKGKRTDANQGVQDGDTESESEEKDGDAISPHDVARNVLDVLLRLSPPAPKGAEAGNGNSSTMMDSLSSWCGAAEVGVVAPANDVLGARQRKQKRRVALDEGNNNDNEEGVRGAVPVPAMVAKWASERLRRRAYSDAWMALLRLDLPDDAYRKALARLHDIVIPNLTSPLLLSDYLTYSLDKGGFIGMLALNGIFLLVTKHGLEYPKFYERLYNLLDADCFLSRHRLRFFQLADVFLASSLVPAYTAAAFAKRFARLALSAPPAGALIAITFMHNILRRHPACMQLLHRSPPGGVAVAAASAAPSDARGTGPVWEGEDVYDPREPDPAKARALESSLWELTALRCHADPTVSSYCHVFEKDLSNKKRTAELEVSEVLKGSYASVFTRELERRLKSVPAAFYREPPSKLFDRHSAADFQGWTI